MGNHTPSSNPPTILEGCFKGLLCTTFVGVWNLLFTLPSLAHDFHVQPEHRHGQHLLPQTKRHVLSLLGTPSVGFDLLALRKELVGRPISLGRQLFSWGWPDRAASIKVGCPGNVATPREVVVLCHG